MLEPERLIQLDLGFDVDKGPIRASVNGFYGWIHDYITYEAAGRNFIPFLDDALERLRLNCSGIRNA